MAKIQSSKDARFYSGKKKIVKPYFFLGFKYIKAPKADLR